MKIKTSQLSGPALDWAVAKADGVSVGLHYNPTAVSNYWVVHSGTLARYKPSIDWVVVGCLIQLYHITLESSLDGTHWSAQCPDKEWPCWHQQEGHGPLEAVCRAIVASLLGDEVEVPDELLP